MWHLHALIEIVTCTFLSDSLPYMSLDINFIEHVKTQHDGAPDPSRFIYDGPVQTMACYGHCRQKSSGRMDQAANGPDHVSLGTAHVFYTNEANRNYGVRVLNPPVNEFYLLRFGLKGNRRIIRRRNRMTRENDHGLRHGHMRRPAAQKGAGNRGPGGTLERGMKNDLHRGEDSHTASAEYEIHNGKYARDADSSESNAHMAYYKRDRHAMARGRHHNTRRIIAMGREDEHLRERRTLMHDGHRQLDNYVGNTGGSNRLWPDDWHWAEHVDRFVSPTD